MVVGNGYIAGVPLRPLENHPPLVIDADTAPILFVPFKPLKAVARRNVQIAFGGGGVNNEQLLLARCNKSGCSFFIRSRLNNNSVSLSPKLCIIKMPALYLYNSITLR